MQRALAFDRSPPLAVSLRFFLNVPAFLMLAALLLIWAAIGPKAYTRWHPGVLAATHFVVLGVLSSAMLGAVMQILPVATHIRVLHARISSIVIHGCLVLGVLSLATGFLTSQGRWYTGAVVLLAIAFASFLAAVVGGLMRGWQHRSPGSGEILVAVRLALAALLITIGLGIFLAGLRAGLWSPTLWQRGEWLPGLPDLHVLWGLAGWVGLLVIGVSYQVIPIFQATELYPRRLTDHLAPLVFGLMLVLTAARLSAGKPRLSCRHGGWGGGRFIVDRVPDLRRRDGLAAVESQTTEPRTNDMVLVHLHGWPNCDHPTSAYLFLVDGPAGRRWPRHDANADGRAIHIRFCRICRKWHAL